MRRRIFAGVLASAFVLTMWWTNRAALDHADDEVCYAESPAVAVCGSPDTLPENVIVFPPSAVHK